MKSLAYEDIRKELTDFLRAHPSFKDYNFDASGISALVNTLAYNDHRLGYFSKMLLDESFVDTAHSFPAMLSHAKRLGYTAVGRRAAVIAATVSVVVPVAYPHASVTARRGTKFKATNSSADTRVFTCLDEYGLEEIGETADGKIFSGTALLHEGTIRTTEFAVDASISSPTYDCRDAGLDITTIAVYTQAPGSTSWIQVRQASSPSDVNPSSDVFYASYDRAGIYKLWFSASYPHATKIKVEYLSTNGSSGNGAKIISFVQGPGGATPTDINYYETVSVTGEALSQGGGDGQTTEDLRTAIPAAWRRQYRAVTAEDIKGIITEFYPDTSTVTVWGGEEEPRRRYGKKMVCVVPSSSRILSLGGREEIRRLLSTYKVPGDDIVFVDATVQLVDIVVVVRRNASAASDDEIRRDCLAVMDEVLGITGNAGITEFSSQNLAAVVKSRVVGVDYAYPTVTFHTEINADTARVVQLNYGNAVHAPIDAGGAAQRHLSEGVVELSVAAGKTIVTATPVVPELKALRRVYFEIRSRKVKVIK